MSDRPVPAIEAVGLRKQFGRLAVLQGIDLEIPPGSVTAIVGPNAAGKSTFIKSVLGLVHPDGGRLRVLGADPRDGDSYRARVGYMPQAARFPENLTGHEVLRLLSGLRGHPDDQDRELIDTFALDGQLHKPIRTLSGGTRQKLNAVVAFLFRPALVILDEPTAGLGPRRQRPAQRQGSGGGGRGYHGAAHLASDGRGRGVGRSDRFSTEGRIRFHGTVEELRGLTGEAKLERAVARLMPRAA